MTAALRVIGIDPGPIPGLTVLDVADGELTGVEALQCTHRLLPVLLEALVGETGNGTLVATETFVVRGRAARSSSAGAGAVTREALNELRSLVPALGAEYRERAAAHVKPWATDLRLANAGLLEPTKGMRHARDAGRHALFAAVRDGGMPDPLSKSTTTARRN